MNFKSEEELINFGREFGQKISGQLQKIISNQPDQKNTSKTNNSSRVIELIGDVGAGKTTFTRGLAEGLGATEPITSPSFTISKRYAIKNGILAHYDFYRLPDPGLMSEDLAESISDPQTITVIEWADTIKNVLPANRLIFQIRINDDGTRTILERNK